MHSIRPIRLATAGNEIQQRSTETAPASQRAKEGFSFLATGQEILDAVCVSASVNPEKDILRSRRLRRNGGTFQDGIVLHVGSGAPLPSRLHAVFKSKGWHECRCDIDASTEPDIIASIVDMKLLVDDETCRGIWASHVLEHLSQEQVPLALREFRRVLMPDGFALMRSPDAESIAQFILDGRIRDVIYKSAAGPITPLDMLYGHGASIAGGKEAMRHGTAFTERSMGEELLAAGFSEVRTTRTLTHEVWAAAFMPKADIPGILEDLALSGIDLRC